MGSSLHPLAIRAAKWWADQLCSIKPFHTSVWDDANKPSQKLKRFAKELVDDNRSEAQETLDPQKIKKFETALAALISAELQGLTFCYIATDYDPGPILQAAAREAGIDLEGFVLPVKTRVRVSSTENEITVLQQGRKSFKL